MSSHKLSFTTTEVEWYFKALDVLSKQPWGSYVGHVFLGVLFKYMWNPTNCTQQRIYKSMAMCERLIINEYALNILSVFELLYYFSLLTMDLQQPLEYMSFAQPHGLLLLNLYWMYFPYLMLICIIGSIFDVWCLVHYWCIIFHFFMVDDKYRTTLRVYAIGTTTQSFHSFLHNNH